MGNIEGELKELKHILDNDPEMKDLQRYDRIYDTITKILGLIPLTDAFMRSLEKELV